MDRPYLCYVDKVCFNRAVSIVPQHISPSVMVTVLKNC